MAKSVEIELPEQLTIANIHPVHEQLETLVDDRDHDHFIIHAGAVKKADTAGIQLLYAFVVAANERRMTLNWDSPSEDLVAAADLLGMRQHLGFSLN